MLITLPEEYWKPLRKLINSPKGCWKIYQDANILQLGDAIGITANQDGNNSTWGMLETTLDVNYFNREMLKTPLAANYSTGRILEN